MEKAEDLLSSQSACDRRLMHSESEHPLVLQLGGSDIKLMECVARMTKDYGFSEININCG